MEAKDATEYYLEPGCIFFSKVAATVRTVVGNCVVVCLWDKQLQYGGIAHFLYPSTDDPREATAKYGNVATTELVRIMEEAGCKRDSLVAQLLGGASAAETTDDHVGERNVAIAQEVLERKEVQILSEDVGGTMGRKVVFNTLTGELAVLKVHRIRTSDWKT